MIPNADRQRVSLAISTCPNDTFAFHAILNKCINLQGLDFDVQLLDIQQLNDGLFAGKFDVAKASFHAALLLSDQTLVMKSGSALGFGVGPLLLTAREGTRPDDRDRSRPSVTLCPGPHTTATLLLKLFYHQAIEEQRTRIEHQLFSDIMPMLKSKQADFGVCIHEGRFTWQQHGLSLVEDLGTRWEETTRQPLPLGGILVRRSLDAEIRQRVQQVIRNSIQYGLQNRQETLPTMRQYAAEFDDAVLMQHVDLYVNDWTIDLGSTGREALATLSRLATEAGIVTGQRPLELAG